MSLYRNDSETNSYYRKQTHFPIEKVFHDDAGFCFDEWGGISRAWTSDGLPLYDELIMDDIAFGFNGFHLTKELTGRFSPYKEYQTDLSARYRKMKHIMYSFMDGELTRLWTERGQVKSEPVLYAHFQKRQMKVAVPDDAGEFLIAGDAFLPYEAQPDAAAIRRLTGRAFSFRNTWIRARRALRDLLR